MAFIQEVVELFREERAEIRYILGTIEYASESVVWKI
jgi:hypothetical protein